MLPLSFFRSCVPAFCRARSRGSQRLANLSQGPGIEFGNFINDDPAIRAGVVKRRTAANTRQFGESAFGREPESLFEISASILATQKLRRLSSHGNPNSGRAGVRHSLNEQGDLRESEDSQSSRFCFLWQKLPPKPGISRRTLSANARPHPARTK